MSEAYQKFLLSKVKPTENFGFEISPESVHPYLKFHQRDIVVWGIRGGHRAIFAKWGLGKTIMQLEILRQINLHKGGKHLIVCPLGVKSQFQLFDGPTLGMDIHFVKTDADVEDCDSPFMVTNYEPVRDGKISLKHFTSVTLDEAAVLRDFGSKTYQTFLEIFKPVPYRFVATATPDPNKTKELIHYAGFLGICDTGLILTEYFQRNSQKAADLTLYPHKEKDFWTWISQWAVFLDRPSDLGYNDAGYDLPPLDVHYHMTEVDHSTAGFDSWGQGKLYRDATLSLKDAAREKRDSIGARISNAIEIINGQPADTHWMIMYHLEDERRAVQKAFPEAKAVYGSLEIEKREQLIVDFVEGKYRIHSSKPDLTGIGCNFQHHCYSLIFLGINYSFHDIIQTIMRLYRFMQKHRVQVHFIYSESEQGIVESFKKKWKKHDAQYETMREIMKTYGLADNVKRKELTRSLGIERKEIKGKRFTCVNNDCVPELESLPDNHFGAIITSIPFGTQYEYTNKLNDMGHNPSTDAFFEQMDFAIPQMLRTLKPGRIAVVHTKNRIRFGHVTGLGFPKVERFVHKTADAFEKNGFHFIGEIPVTTDVVFENNQTNRLGWSENAKDSSKMGCGMPEYLLLFRKVQTDTTKGYADERVAKSKEDYPRRQWQLDAHAHWKSNGDRLMMPEEISSWDLKKIIAWWKGYDKSHVYDYDAHVELGRELTNKGRLPSTFMLFKPTNNTEWLWDDIVRMRTLNGNQSMKNLAMHVCPLQIDLVKRCITRFTNPGDLILDPFGGLMTVGYCAIEMGREFYGIELSEQYWADGVSYCRAAEHKLDVPTLFDALEIEPGDSLDFTEEQLAEMKKLSERTNCHDKESNGANDFERLVIDARSGNGKAELVTEHVDLAA